MAIAEDSGRAERVEHWLERCPSTISVIQQLDSWSYTTAFRYVQKLIKYGKTSELGEVLIGKGKPQKFYGKKCKIDNPRHEVAISQVLVHFELEGWPWIRAEDVDQRYRADSDLHQYGRAFYLEVDFDTERRKALEKRLRLYEGIEGFVLFVAPSEKRIREAKEIAWFLQDQLLLTKMCNAVKDAFAPNIWEDIYGNKWSL